MKKYIKDQYIESDKMEKGWSINEKGVNRGFLLLSEIAKNLKI